jgi:ABC-2 type transport system ATP-binding protein
MEEVEQICTRIAIMDKGKQIAIGTKQDLQKLIKNTETITIEIIGLSKENIDEISKISHIYDCKYENNRLILKYSGGKHNLTRILNYLQENELAFGRVFTELPTLNDVFLEITGKTLRD